MADEATGTYTVLHNMRVGAHRYTRGDEVELPKSRGDRLVEQGAVSTPGEFNKQNAPEQDYFARQSNVQMDNPVDPGDDQDTGENPARGRRVQNSQDGNRITGRESRTK